MEKKLCKKCNQERPMTQWRFSKRTCCYEAYCMPCKKLYDLKYVTKKRYSHKTSEEIEVKIELFKTKLAIMEEILNERRNSDTI